MNGLLIEHCQNCDGELKINAAILDQPVIEKNSQACGCRCRVLPGDAHGQKQVDKFYTADGAESVTPIPQKRNADFSGA